MKIYHISPSKGQRCGIASFASTLNPCIPDSELIGGPDEISENRPLLVQHEYGLQRNIAWEKIGHTSNKKTLIQHAFSTHAKYRDVNIFLFETFDKIVFLSKRCKIEACNTHPEFVHKFVVIPHFSEELRNDPVDFPIDGNYTIGIHGFAFPRNGFMKLLNKRCGKTKIYMMASISAFNSTAEMETGVYIDKMRRKIWQMEEEVGKFVELDFNYHETKDDIISKLKEKCNALVHLIDPMPYYYNASGSIHVLMATGLPVFAMKNSIFAEPFSTNVLNRINDPSDMFDRNKLNITTTTDGIVEYNKNNSVRRFADRVLDVIKSLP